MRYSQTEYEGPSLHSERVIPWIWLVGVGRGKAMLPEPFSNPYKLNPYFFYLLYMVLMMLYFKVVVNLFYSNITI